MDQFERYKDADRRVCVLALQTLAGLGRHGLHFVQKVAVGVHSSLFSAQSKTKNPSCHMLDCGAVVSVSAPKPKVALCLGDENDDVLIAALCALRSMRHHAAPAAQDVVRLFDTENHEVAMALQVISGIGDAAGPFAGDVANVLQDANEACYVRPATIPFCLLFSLLLCSS